MDGMSLNAADPSKLLSNIASEVTLVSIIVTLAIAVIGWYFFWRQEKEKKRGMMFDWVHGELSTKIYIPLNGWIKALYEILSSWDNQEINYKTSFLLYTLSKFLRYRYINKHTVGDDVFFTNSISSNQYLYELMDLILIEINTVLEKNLPENEKSERRFILTQFLSKLGNSNNYTEFVLSIRARNLYNKTISDEIKMSINDLYEEGFLFKLPDQINFYMIAVRSLFSLEVVSSYTRTKLKTYCILFYYIMWLELYYMYSDWYRKENIPSIKVVYACFKHIKELVELTDKELDNYSNLAKGNRHQPMKEDILDIEFLEEIMENLEIGIDKTKNISKKEELNAKRESIMMEIYRRKIIKNIKKIDCEIALLNRIMLPETEKIIYADEAGAYCSSRYSS